jgi:probable F420-dependent oxidoreductase
MPNIGVCFVNPAPEVSPRFVIEMARKAEEIGLHSLWVNDRVTYDNLEPLTVLSAASAVTRKIKIGTSILLAALRHPVLLAKTAASIDFLSGGRLILGLGVGGSASEFDAVEVPFKGRGGRVAEQIQLMRRLWEGNPVTHEGRYFRLRNLNLGPKTIQDPCPPVWLGGAAEAALKRVGLIADGYICGTGSLKRFEAVWEKICGYAGDAGRNPGSIEKAGISYIAIDQNKSRAVAACEAYLKRYYGKVTIDVDDHTVFGPPAECVEKIARLFNKGLGTLILRVVKPELRQLDLLGAEVLPQLQGRPAAPRSFTG